MAIVEVSIVPIGTGETSVSRYVARAVELLGQSSLRYELTAMGTVIEGDLDTIWSVIRRMQESCFELGVARLLTHMKIDDRRDRTTSAEAKVRSVLSRLPEA